MKETTYRSSARNGERCLVDGVGRGHGWRELSHSNRVFSHIPMFKLFMSQS